jgi:hypothetical protein
MDDLEIKDSSMPIQKTVCCAVLFFGSIALAQPIPVYKDQEDYCYHNPQAVGCRDGRPVNVMEEMQKNWEKMQKENQLQFTPTSPTTRVTAPQPARVTAPSSPRVQRLRSSASPSIVQVGELDWRFAHPHPDLLIGIDMESLMGSELMRTLLRDWAGKLGATPKEQDQMLNGLGDTKRVLISISNREMLAMMVGNVGNLPVGPQAGGLQFTRLSEDTALMSSEGASFGALTRLKLQALPNAQQDEAKLMARTYDFWVWGRSDRLAGLNPGMSANSPVKRVKMGVTFRDGFNFQLILDTPDAASAARLLEGMQKRSPRGMQGAVEGSSVRYAMVLDREAALQRFAGFMTDSMGKNFAPLIAAARQMSARQAAAARPAGKIVIDGLDDGPKEVPVAQKQ